MTGWIFNNLPAPPGGGAGQIFLETVTETWNVQDQTSLARFMSQLETQDAVDSAMKLLLKNAPENQAVADSVTKILAQVALDNLAALSDTASSAIVRSFSAADTVLVTDTVQKFLFANPQENQAIADIITRLLIKAATENQAISDSAALVRLMILRDPEAVLLTDSARKSLSLILTAENQAVADAARKTLTKYLTEAQAVADASSVALIKQIGEIQTVADSLSKSLFLRPSENQALSDTVAKTIWKYLTEDQRPITDSSEGTIFRIVAAFVENVLTEITDMALRTAGVADPGRRVTEIIEQAVREAKTKGMRR